MKRHYYRDNSSKPIYHRFAIGMIPLGSFFLLLSFMLIYKLPDFVDWLSLVEMSFFFIGIGFLIIGLIALIAYLAEQSIPNADVPRMDLKARHLAFKIVRKFSATMLADVLKIAPKTRWGYMLPVVEAYVSDDLSEGYILIENLGAYEKISKSTLIESISGILQSRGLKNYEVVRADLELGGVFMRFDFENLVNSNRLIVKNNDLMPFVSSNCHDIKLGNDVTWHARKYPMMALIARTGAGKSVFAGYISELAKLQGWEVRYNSAKKDKHVMKFNGAFVPEDIVKLAESYVTVMRRRLEQVAGAEHDDYADIGLNDVLLVFDELGHLNALLADDKKLKQRWESALKSLAMTGRSAGIHLLLISQFGTIDGFVNSSVRAQVSDNVVMLGNAASSASERQCVMGGYADLPTRYYDIGEGLALISGSGRKWQEPHYYQAPWIEK